MTGPLVLVAEDDPSVRMTLDFVLKDEGFEVVCANDGVEALEKARELIPAVILLDHKMPKMDGQEVYAELRMDDSTKHIPVLVLSGMSRDGGKGWEGAEFVGKPFSPDQLVATIRKVLGEKAVES